MIEDEWDFEEEFRPRSNAIDEYLSDDELDDMLENLPSDSDWC